MAGILSRLDTGEEQNEELKTVMKPPKGQIKKANTQVSKEQSLRGGTEIQGREKECRSHRGWEDRKYQTKMHFSLWWKFIKHGHLPKLIRMLIKWVKFTYTFNS